MSTYLRGLDLAGAAVFPGVAGSYEEAKLAVQRKVLDRIDPRTISSEPGENARAELRQLISGLLLEEGCYGREENERVTQEILDEIVGLGPLEPLMRDETISDILVNAADTVYVERRGQLELAPVHFRDNQHLLRVIERIVARVGRRVDETSPLVDARLPDGSRVNAAVPPVAIDGPALCIRRFGAHALSPEALVNNRALTEEMRKFLEGCIRARLNIVIAGGTGSGKTTLMNALSSYIPEQERIVTIEDAAELRLQQRHVVRLETRPASVDGMGAISIRQLLVNALRMRPDRIIVGEVRSAEALDMLQAMNTGHDGSLTTIHANSPRDALTRLETMVGMANSGMGIRSVRYQMASAINILIQVARLSDGTRRITHITECLGMEGEIITLQDVFQFEQTGVTADGRVRGRFRATGIRPKICERLARVGMETPARLFEMMVEIN
jgi:pilus assembly protein CpaF